MGTYIPNKQTRQQTQKLRVQRTEAYAQRVKREYEQAVNSILALKKSVPDLPTGQMYSFDGDTKKVQRQVNTILRQLHSATLTTIKTGVETEWEQANKEVDSLLRSALGKKAMENPDLAGWFTRNEEAMDAFLTRSNEGMNLSDRVWKNTRQLRDEMEVAMTVAIGEGQSASQMSRRVRQYLNDPDLMFRRFRYKDEDGNWQLKWKKRVMDDNGRYHFVDYDRNSYKVGAGNYKSSYKNAMRLTRTETNMAYRRADHDRWQGMEFVLGQKIETSNAHDPKEDKDICDELAGDYPKEFVFDGWHPQCMCMCTAIMVSEEEMVARMQARLRGGSYEFKEKPIKTYPKGFRDFVKNNRQNIIDAQERGKQPYFLANNAGVVNDILNKDIVPDVREEDKSLILSTLEKAKIRQSQRTPEQVQDIKKRWKDSRAINTSLAESEKVMPGARQLYAREVQENKNNPLYASFQVKMAANSYERDTKEMSALGYERQRDFLRDKIAKMGDGTSGQIEKRALQLRLAEVEGHIAKGEHRDPMELKAARQAMRTEAQRQAILDRWKERTTPATLAELDSAISRFKYTHPVLKEKEKELDEKMKQLFDDNDFGMDVDPKVLESIFEKGFLNQFETGTSYGSLGSTSTTGQIEEKNIRLVASHRMFGMGSGLRMRGSGSSYDGKQLNRSEYEKYGLLLDKDKTKSYNVLPSHYGGAERVQVRFKKDKVKTTWTYSDSLDAGHNDSYYQPTLTSDPKVASFDENIYTIRSEYKGKETKEDKETQMYLDKLMQSDHDEWLKKSREHDNDILRRAVDNLLKSDDWNDLTTLRKKLNNWYFEIQYHGKVTMDDVQSLTFYDNPELYISKDMIQKLANKGIELWYMDSHTREATRYKP